MPSKFGTPCRYGNHCLNLGDRKVVTSYNEGLKREFRDSFDEQKLGADTYFCDTMEPTWRNLLGVELEPQLVDARLGRVSGKKAQKILRPHQPEYPDGQWYRYSSLLFALKLFPYFLVYS